MQAIVFREEFALEESKTVEFKAHDRLAVTQMTTKEIEERRFQPSSRTIGAFLNINKPCSLYLGVRDDGIVTGHPMFNAQKEHFKLSLDQLLKHKFDPPVDSYRYSIHYHAVQIPDQTPTRKEPALTIAEAHLMLQQPGHCWCEVEINKMKRDNQNQPAAAPHYIIQVQINPWDPAKDSNGYKVWPYYSTEEGKCFLRYSASNHEVTQLQIVEETKINVQELYSKEQGC